MPYKMLLQKCRYLNIIDKTIDSYKIKPHMIGFVNKDDKFHLDNITFREALRNPIVCHSIVSFKVP